MNKWYNVLKSVMIKIKIYIILHHNNVSVNVMKLDISLIMMNIFVVKYVIIISYIFQMKMIVVNIV